MRDTITVLFLASHPSSPDRTPRLEEEVCAIEHAAGGGRGRHRVRLVPRFVAGSRDLRDALLRHDPRIVHFAGHADDPCVLYLDDGQGRRRPVGKEPLAKLFGTLREWIRVVVVNGRGALPTVEALGEAVDYAIGMDRPLSDPSAVAFARAFYGALAIGRTVQAAFDVAVIQMMIEDGAEPGSARLRIRPGVDPSVPLVSALPVAVRGYALRGAGRP